MKFAYADPPYLGYSSFYAMDHPDSADWDDPETHRRFIERLCDDYADGWVLSMTSGNLHDILPMCPKEARVGAWVKPFCSFKKYVSPAYAWEPVVFMGGRKHDVRNRTVRDWLAESIALERGLTGAKPENFCRWVIALMKARLGDSFDDLFPGTGVFDETWDRFQSERRSFLLSRMG